MEIMHPEEDASVSSITFRDSPRQRRTKSIPQAGQQFGELRGYYRLSSVPSRIFAALLLVASAPLIVMLIVLVRLTSPGPGIYRQKRVGLFGRHFWLYKIRTMRSDAEHQSGAVWARTGDPRVTRLGRFLRRTHLDEFPQLINVIKGEMALVGPRPERPEFTRQLAVEIPHYLDRLAVRPGITGLAQINLPPDTDLDSVRRKLVLDLEYIRTGSMPFDLRIMLATLCKLLFIPKRLTVFALRLRCRPTDEQVDAMRWPTVDRVAGIAQSGVNGNGRVHFPARNWDVSQRPR